MKKGFTLIELLVVVLIIGILAAIALPQYTKAVEKSRWSEAKIMVKALKDAQDRYFLATGEYTSNLTDLDIEVPSSTKYFTYIMHTSPLLHIEANRTGQSIWMVKYAGTEEIFCAAANGSEENKKLCKTITSREGIACPEPGYTCFPI
ncbi:PilE-like protein [Elusimicrobium minutum Pei191]|uniref:PilE-like protein n=1 Tax=Elusimicrobium minutum (strain Pei191) TaxID=445932 RepID=B2KBZ5_ELUMP|nr:type IV pilin-like G/H family protein [Elusimicrobium minutum]ACC98122.1 PilE-like protein [Elusimicrobium minutum Pei191]